MSLDAIAIQLQKDFMHRTSDDCSCAVCGDGSKPLAFHVLQKSYTQGNEPPKGFVPMSMSMGQYVVFFQYARIARLLAQVASFQLQLSAYWSSEKLLTLKLEMAYAENIYILVSL